MGRSRRAVDRQHDGSLSSVRKTSRSLLKDNFCSSMVGSLFKTDDDFRDDPDRLTMSTLGHAQNMDQLLSPMFHIHIGFGSGWIGSCEQADTHHDGYEQASD